MKAWIFSICCSLPFLPHAQDITSLRSQSPKVNGSIGGGLRFYDAEGIVNRNDPFVWTTSGTLNINMYGMNLPFSFIASSQNQDFRQPFNRFGASPTYKWATVHLGYRSMEFSPYTMSGNSVLGVGVDLRPGKFRFSSIYGRLRTAVEEDTLSVIRVNPSYKRTGYAVSAGYQDAGNFILMTILKAADDPESISQPVKSAITPEDNLVWSLRGSKTLGDQVTLRGEFAQSALNRDIRSEQVSNSGNFLYNSLGSWFRPTTSLQVSNAIDAALVYRISAALSFDMDYQRVDPNYRTLGAYFFNNDREQISVNTTANLIENKLQVRAGFGTTRNNLESTQSQTLARRAGNINAAYSFNPNLNVSANYSNFHSVINFIEDPLNPQRNPEDTLNVVQVSQSAGLFANYNFQGAGRNHSTTFNATYQGQAPGAGSANEQVTTNGMYNLNALYRLSFTASKTSLTMNMNFNENDFGGVRTQRFGPTAGATQALLKSKIRLRLTTSFLNSYAARVQQNVTYNTRFAADWRIDKHQLFTAGFGMVNRRTRIEPTNTPSFNEYITTVGYTFRF